MNRLVKEITWDRNYGYDYGYDYAESNIAGYYNNPVIDVSDSIYSRSVE